MKTTAHPRSSLPPGWWRTAAGMVRPYLKAHGRTLNDLRAELDHLCALGIDALEVFAPLHGGICYHGLDTLDFYHIDPAIGTLADFQNLVAEAHQRGMAVVMFINLGYAHEQFPAFLQACDDVRAGRDTPLTRWFCWSDSDQKRMDRSRAPYFMNDSHGNWRWSERAGKYFWVKWEGEKGGYHLPQFNFGDPGWRAEVQSILRTWLATGIDGLVIDAVNWYIDCTWEICREVLTDPILQADNQLCQPEGAGGFRDDPLLWVTEGGWNCIMDYAIQLWWEGVDVIGSAVRSGDPCLIEPALRGYRDRVVAAGGVCYINPPRLEDVSVEARLLGLALTAAMGELLILVGDQTQPQPQAYRDGLARLLHLRRKYPQLCAAGPRQQVSTSDDARFYAFTRGEPGERILAVFNLQSESCPVAVNLSGQSICALKDVNTGQPSTPVDGMAAFDLPPYGFRLYEIFE